MFQFENAFLKIIYSISLPSLSSTTKHTRMKIKLKSKEQIKILCADDIFGIMKKILQRENKIDRNREHFWTISLDNANKILNIELVSLGSIKETVVEPMEVLSIPLQKRAVKIILVHNHPSRELIPSEADKDITDRLIQCGLIMHVPILDHMIISEKKYYSFEASGLLNELEKSTKYVPNFILKERWEKQMKEVVAKTKKSKDKIEKKLKEEIAKTMKSQGFKADQISTITGLSIEVIKRIR